MRTFLVGFAVTLMAAGAAFGYTEMKILGPGGVSTFVPTPGVEFEITIMIETDEPLVSWGASLSGPAGTTMRRTASATSITYNNYADAYDADFEVWTNSAGWDPATGFAWGAGGTATSHWALPIDLAALTLYDVNSQPIGSTSGFAFRGFLKVTEAAGQIDGLLASAGDMTFQNTLDKVTPLLLPEPVSALLLLAGLPMLRRRR